MAPNRRLVIFGCGNFAETAHYFFVHDSTYDVVAFAVDGEFLKAKSFCERPIVAFENVRQQYPPENHDLFIAVGVRDLNRRRAAKVQEAESMGYRVASYVSSRAIIPADQQTGANTWIMETAHVHPFVSIGRNTIIWSSSTVGIKSQIGKDCWIAGSIVGDGVTVGDGTFLGLGSVIASFTTVGKGNIVGAGAVIVKDTNDFEIYRGPASKASRVPSTRFGKFNG